MLDPLTALGLAGNVIQTVDFTAKLGSALREIHNSLTGATEENDALEALSQSTKDAAEALIAELNSNPATRNESHLRDSATDCSNVSQHVIDITARMKRSGSRSLKRSLRATWHVLWDDSKKKRILEDLDRCQQNLQISLVRLLR